MRFVAILWERPNSRKGTDPDEQGAVVAAATGLLLLLTVLHKRCFIYFSRLSRALEYMIRPKSVLVLLETGLIPRRVFMFTFNCG